jgi:hypothetical protein
LPGIGPLSGPHELHNWIDPFSLFDRHNRRFRFRS